MIRSSLSICWRAIVVVCEAIQSNEDGVGKCSGVVCSVEGRKNGGWNGTCMYLLASANSCIMEAVLARTGHDVAESKRYR